MAATPPESTGPPNWLDSDFIKSALKNEFTVNSVYIEDAVPAGENFATVVYRALVDTTSGPISLIIKCVPESEFRARFVQDGKLMVREIRMYDKTLPMLRGDFSHPNFPFCYNVVQEESSRAAIILQDMRPLGYRTRQRRLGLDVAHCRLALKELAHIHGLSAALRFQQPDVFKSELQNFYIESFYAEENKERYHTFYKSTLQTLSEAIKFHLPYRFDSIANKMYKIASSVFDILANSVKLPTDEGEIAKKVLVLNHGDYWSNNILFQYDDENSTEPRACSPIDFQLSRVAPPVLDLLYLFYISTEQVTRSKYMDELLQLYLDETLAVMRKKGVEQPCTAFYQCVSDIRKDMMENAAFGFFNACFILPSVIADATVTPDLENLTVEEMEKMESSPFLKLYSGPLFCRRIRELLEDFDDMGFFTKLGE